jgi:hypothetical protein
MPRRIAVHVNKTLDVVERTAWTFLNTFLGLITLSSLTNVNLSTVHELEAAAIAAAYTTLKTLAAQHVGDSELGAAIPGRVVKSASHR